MARISFQGKPLHTCGELPAVNTTAPDFTLVDEKLQDVTLQAYQGKRKILNIIPSLDTPVCAASARRFNEKSTSFDNTVVLLISADLPFAQCRFCESEGLKNVVALSTFRSSFGEDYGVTLTDTFLAGLTARAVIILNEKNQVLYAQLVNELTNEPDYDAALAVLGK